MKNLIPFFIPWFLILLSACNSDDDFQVSGPRISLADSDGRFTVKIGKQLVIEPIIENLTSGSRAQWVDNGEVISTSPVLQASWTQPGEHFLTLTVTNSAGSASAQFYVDVVEKEIPYISLPFVSSVINVLTGTNWQIVPEVAATDVSGFEIMWKVDGETIGNDLKFSFDANTPGDYKVEVSTKNADGSDSKQFTLRVADTLPSSVRFPSQSILQSSTRRYTFADRPVCLVPILDGLAGEHFEWRVDGVKVQCTSSSFTYTPQVPGTVTVSVTVDNQASASVDVECVADTELGRMRAKTGSSSAYSDKIYEWIPAPGQFIGCTAAGGMTGEEKTHQQAIDWATARLAAGNYVSLGAFGGYIIVGFDHSIAATTGAHCFSIGGNAFNNADNTADGSNEPGIVYVSQDVNGNGLPDDEWYELKGSDSFLSTTVRSYAVTYYRPAGPGMNVQWTDNRGGSGTIDYLKATHRQDYYYPAWVTTDSYTLYGTALSPQTSQNTITGNWNNRAFGWGYADNVGSDNISVGSAGSGLGQAVGFKLDNAVLPDGSPIKLQYVDFVKVQTGVQSKAGGLGEVSTEVTGFKDLSM